MSDDDMREWPGNQPAQPWPAADAQGWTSGPMGAGARTMQLPSDTEALLRRLGINPEQFIGWLRDQVRPAADDGSAAAVVWRRCTVCGNHHDPGLDCPPPLPRRRRLAGLAPQVVIMDEAAALLARDGLGDDAPRMFAGTGEDDTEPGSWARPWPQLAVDEDLASVLDGETHWRQLHPPVAAVTDDTGLCAGCGDESSEARLCDRCAGFWVVVLTSHQPYHVSAAWICNDAVEAKRFAAFITAEVDPAMALLLQEPTDELMRWRDEIAQPAMDRAAKIRALAERWDAAASTHIMMNPALAASCKAHADALRELLGE